MIEPIQKDVKELALAYLLFFLIFLLCSANKKEVFLSAYHIKETQN
jgi:hypothetical protein